MGTESMAVMERISLEQLCSQLAMSILANCGSRGNSAITSPSGTSSPCCRVLALLNTESTSIAYIVVECAEVVQLFKSSHQCFRG